MHPDYLKCLFDFDGVIQDAYKWEGYYKFTRPKEGIHNFLVWLSTAGIGLTKYKTYQFVIFTARPDVAEVQKFLYENNLWKYFDHITNIKEWSDYYFDDKCFEIKQFDAPTLFSIADRLENEHN